MKVALKFSLMACGLFFSNTAFAATAGAQDNATHEHHCDMTSRGNDAMGFDAAKTTHHFLQTPAGGAIEVTANDHNDAASREAVQHHLQHIAQRFKQGDFEIPMLVHDQVPPGVPAMKRLKAEISYEYVGRESGGRVEISTKNPEALEAIHNFLRFQIQEHHTGDTQ